MIKNWLVRGDTHGNFVWIYNEILNNYQPEETAIIILGDAGFNFYLNKTDKKIKEQVNNYHYIIYCVRGNHEARPQNVPGMLEVFDPEVNGYVYIENDYPYIRYFKDYGIYTIDGYSVGIIGGAYSIDKWYRLARAGIMSKLDQGYTNSKRTGWFPDEQLSNEEMDDAEKLFMGKKLDFVMTHTCQYSWRPVDLFLHGVDQSSVDNTMEKWLDKLKDEFEWNIWLFGHYHVDRLERPHVEMYYNDIEQLETVYDRWRQYDSTGTLPWWVSKSPNFDF
jgi:3-oxoacid CoA-transferase subunit A